MSRASGVPEATDVSPWSWIRDGLTTAERGQARHMMFMAILSGEAGELWVEAVREFRQTRQDLRSAGVWNQVCQFYRDRKKAQLESAKRPREGAGPPQETMEAYMDEDFLLLMDEQTELDREPEPPSMSYVADVVRGDASTSYCQTAWRTGMPSMPLPSQAVGLAPPRVNAFMEPPRRPEHRLPIMPAFQEQVPEPFEFELPADVSTWESWGKTVVAFGKHGNKGVTYIQLASSTDAGFRDYKKWVLSRLSTSSGQCQDLGKYLQIYEKMYGSQPTIPGTNMVRTYAD